MKKQLSHIDSDVQALEGVAKATEDRFTAEIADLKEKQARIAESHEVAGRIQAMTVVGKMLTVSTLVQLKRVKDSKVYRDLPNIGTWDNYCEYLGLSRQKVDVDLLNLIDLGEDFLLTCQQFHIGYRDLRKLRQLSHDGTITIDADAVEIKGERIPLDSDHKEDLQAAIEQIIEEQARVKEELADHKKANDRVLEGNRKEMVKLEKELRTFTAAAEAKGLTGAEDAFVQLVEKYRIMAQGSLIALEPLELVKDGLELTPRMKAKAISTVYELKMQILALYDTVVTEIGDPVMNPELLEDFAKWEQENGFK